MLINLLTINLGLSIQSTQQHLPHHNENGTLMQGKGMHSTESPSNVFFFHSYVFFLTERNYRVYETGYIKQILLKCI